MAYGSELILDLHDCDVSKFTRASLDQLFKQLCSAIDMQQCERHFWDDVGVPEEEKQTDPKTKGTSAIQFILTSNITIHTLQELRCVYFNLFSCKAFDHELTSDMVAEHFKGSIAESTLIIRQ